MVVTDAAGPWGGTGGVPSPWGGNIGSPLAPLAGGVGVPGTFGPAGGWNAGAGTCGCAATGGITSGTVGPARGGNTGKSFADLVPFDCAGANAAQLPTNAMPKSARPAKYWVLF